MTPAEIRSEIDTRIQAQLSSIASKQIAWQKSKGIYFQLLETHTTLPKDGEDVAPDNADAKPHYQTASGRQMGGIPSLAMSSTRIDIYEGPRGKGYMVTSSVLLGSDRWERTLNFGPETHFAKDWAIINGSDR